MTTHAPTLNEIAYHQPTKAAINGIEIVYDSFGNSEDPLVLLIMGMGMQMVAWQETFCRKIAAHGFHVVRYDNRDIGLSTRFDGQPKPGLLGLTQAFLFKKLLTTNPYTLTDMANDAAGLLDHLEVDSAHIVGISLGGMIAQVLALNHLGRVKTLTSIMSTTGEPDLPLPSTQALLLLTRSRPSDRDGYINSSVDVFNKLSGSRHPSDPEEIKARSAIAYDRAGYYPEGGARHLGAVVSSPGRREALRHLAVPTVVIHGDEDPLVPYACGVDTAKAIPNAKMVTIKGLGHVLPSSVWEEVIGHITALANENP